MSLAKSLLLFVLIIGVISCAQRFADNEKLSMNTTVEQPDTQ